MTDFRKKLLRFLPLTFDQVVPQNQTEIGHYVEFPQGFHGTNPSIVPFEDGYLVCIRGLNYVLSGKDMGEPVFTVGSHFMTVNRFFLLDREFRLRRTLPALDSTFDDVEDIKLFMLNGVIMGVGSCADPGRTDIKRCIGLLTINAAFDGGHRQLIASPFGLRYEKNWAPFVHEKVLHFIYSFDPLIILRCDPVNGSVSFADPRFGQFAPDDLKFLLGGSSAGLVVPGGFLFAAHRRRVSLPRMHRNYVSRLYRLEVGSMTIMAGRFFSLGPASIQFINGLVQSEGDLVFSYGQMDRSAHLCRVPMQVLASKFTPVTTRVSGLP